jgi:hypothetical protein
VAGDRLPRAYACHCLDCQTWSGSAFSLQCVLAASDLTVTGETVLFELPHPSGLRTSYQHVCGRCHTRIYNQNTARPGLSLIRAGTLDRSDELDVVAHIWTKRRQPWLILPDSVPSWAEFAPPEAMAALLRPT